MGRGLYTEKLLKKSSLDQMWTPVKLNDGSTYPYGFAWDVTEAGGHRLLEHGGSWQGFRSQISRYVDDRLTVVVLANSAEAAPSFIAHSIAGFYLPAAAPPSTRELIWMKKRLQHSQETTSLNRTPQQE